ncbi:Zn-dependent hydrolase, including glyoxylase [Longilinea arvoryzae]|uniref:Zn-dependent hydrolase, including glyoxylase n=1 Tax=Longilinea arvoryzae TaxID=360412 RepID=A0A0S7BKC4_9CHLR|nr:MBL fold metallo-hydrolase [Longilinea arvoryzae]GAP14106.1 Zn-dependent hydrolase, including glyoxylase [Longilinea arvoryzae]
MQRERISENVYWFQSEIYAQVTAGAITGPQWAVVIDTLALPEETLAMRSFIEEQLGVPVRYVINTHYHADHTGGNCFFPGATIIGNELCRDLMLTKGQIALEAARKINPIFKQIKIIAPQITFMDGSLSLRVGKKNLVLFPTPGHSSDGISILVEEDRVIFAGDAFLPIPYIIDGNYDAMVNTIKKISKLGLENIIQGHGDIILRGEIDESVKENLNYLSALKKAVKGAARRRNPQDALLAIDVESCGKSRVYLGGLAEELHRRNVRWLYHQIQAEEPIEPSKEETFEEEPEEEPVEILENIDDADEFEEPEEPDDFEDPEDEE